MITSENLAVILAQLGLPESLPSIHSADVPKLLSVGQDAKTVKGEALGVRTAIMYLAPATASGADVCVHASPNCAAVCLALHAGRLAMRVAQDAQIRRTKFFFADRRRFLAVLAKEIQAFRRKTLSLGMHPAIRLNGASDLTFEGIYKDLHDVFGDVTFYDYTKNVRRAHRYLEGKLPENYHLTLSRSETNEAECLGYLRAGGNVAAVFLEALPEEWRGFKVVNGDAHDFRVPQHDGRGVVIGLKAKGRKAKLDESGFVIRP